AQPLPVRRARQPVDEIDDLRRLVRREPPAAVGENLVGPDRAAHPRHDSYRIDHALAAGERRDPSRASGQNRPAFASASAAPTLVHVRSWWNRTLRPDVPPPGASSRAALPRSAARARHAPSLARSPCVPAAVTPAAPT